MTPLPQPEKARFSEKLLIGTSVMLMLLSMYLHFRLGMVGDRDFLLLDARRWMEGGTLYKDIFQANPPLIFYCYAIPVYLADHVGVLQDYNYLALMGCVVSGLVIGLSWRLVRLHPAFAGDLKKQLWFCLLLAFIFMEYTRPNFFFDREHIFLVLVFPYILRYMPALANQSIPQYQRIIIGIVGGIGFCIKPYCLIVLAGLQLVYVLRERKTAIVYSLENCLIYGIIAAYLLLVWVHYPEYTRIVIPMALETYAALSGNAGKLFFFAVSLFLFAVTFADFRLRYASPYRQDILYFVSVCLPFLGYALVNNPWAYVWNPLDSMIMFTTGLVLMEFIWLRQHHQTDQKKRKQLLFGIRACTGNLVINGMMVFVYLYWFATACNEFECVSGKEFLTEVRKINGGTIPRSFGTISAEFNLWAAFARETGAKWDTRFDHLWMLPRFFGPDRDFIARTQWIPEYVSNAYAEDLAKNKPQLVFVDDRERFFSVRHYVNLVAFLDSFPAFRQEWKHYTFVQEVRGTEMAKKTFVSHHPDDRNDTDPYHRNGYYVYKRID